MKVFINTLVIVKDVIAENVVKVFSCLFTHI